MKIFAWGCRLKDAKSDIQLYNNTDGYDAQNLISDKEMEAAIAATYDHYEILKDDVETVIFITECEASQFFCICEVGSNIYSIVKALGYQQDIHGKLHSTTNPNIVVEISNSEPVAYLIGERDDIGRR